jgi:signal transduction histidine kinase
MAAAVGLPLVYVRDRGNDRRLAQQAADDLGKFQKAIIERELESAAAILLQFAEQQELRDFLAGAVGREALEREYAHFCGIGEILDQIRLIASDGREQIRINCNQGAPIAVREGELQSKSDRYYFSGTRDLQRAEVYVSPFDLNVEHGAIEEPWKPVLRLATPVFDLDGAKRGILIFNFLGAQILEPLQSSAKQLPGWTALVNHQGYYLEAPDPDRSWGFMFDRKPTFAHEHSVAWEAMKHVEQGSLLDREGMFTYHAIAPALHVGSAIARSDLELSVVSFVPNALLYANARAAFRRIATLSILTGAIFIAISWRLAQAGAVHELHEQQIAASEKRLRALSSRLIHLQEVERKSISRDLHDEVGQLATAIAIDLKRALKTEVGRVKEELIERALGGTEQLLESMHRISTRIRSSVLDDLGLQAALRSCCEDFEKRSGVDTCVELEFSDTAIPDNVADNVYRCVQEALNNVFRHARAQRAWVRVCVRDGALQLSVADNGIGFDPAKREDRRLGLLGMQERAELLSGTFSIQSEPNHGTQIEIGIPLGPERAAGRVVPA